MLEKELIAKTVKIDLIMALGEEDHWQPLPQILQALALSRQIFLSQISLSLRLYTK